MSCIPLRVINISLSMFMAVLLLSSCNSKPTAGPDGITRVPATFSGGHDTEPVDMGRPVILIASALGVEPAVFREAFSRVNPAPAGTAPSGERVHENKAVLLAALGPLGITNERLDEVSDYYRYRPGGGRLWTNREAEAFALVKDGVVTGFEITDRGAGYSSPPSVSVAGYPNLRVAVQLAFGKDFETNGSIHGMIIAE